MKILSLISGALSSKVPHENEGLPRPVFKGFAQKQMFLADPPSLSSDPSIDWANELKAGGYKVRIKRGIKKVTLFRFLLAKLLYDEDGLHLDEYLVLFELYYNLLDLRDPSFCLKYGDWFNRSSEFFAGIATALEFPAKLSSKNQIQDLYQGLQPVIPSKQAYFGLKGQRNLRQSFSVVLLSELPSVKPPSKRFVGVGYKDKGTRKNEAKDGSPHWTEVASHFSEIERRAEEESKDQEVLQDPTTNKGRI